MADEWSSLRRAVNFQRLDLVRKHAARGPRVCRTSSVPWDPPLVRAVSIAEGSVGEAIVQALLDARHDTNARSTEGEPCLHVACLHQSLAPNLARRLVAAGADLEAHDGRGRTALHAAVEVFTHGFRCDSVELVVALLELGAKVDARDAQGRTPLHVAVSKGTDPLNVVETLLAWHADPDALDDAGTTPWTLLRQVVGAARAENTTTPPVAG